MLRFSCVANGVCLWRRRSLRFARHMTASLIASLLLRCKRRVPVAPSVPSLRSSHDGVAHCFASLALQTACACGAVGPFASLVTRRRRSLLRFSCVANGVCLWRRRSLRFARHVTASLIASLLSRCKRRVPVAPSVPSLRSSHDGVAHCFASLALQTACACGAVGPFASLVTRRRRSLLRFSCVATACACGAVGPFASLVTGRRRSLLRFSCVANGVCLWRRRSLRFARHMTASLIARFSALQRRVPWRRRSLRFARHMTASLIASLLLRCKRRVPVAPSVPSLRSSHDGVAHCFASLALQTACACGAVGPFASLVTGRRRSLLRFSCVANGVCLWRRRSLRFARHMTASLIASLLCVQACRRVGLRFART